MASVAAETLAAGLYESRCPEAAAPWDKALQTRREALINASTNLIKELESVGFEVRPLRRTKAVSDDG